MGIWDGILGTERVEIEEPEIPSFDIQGISKMTLLELSRRNMAIEIYSEILNCDIWLCSNEEMASQLKKDDFEAVTYTVDELRHLLDLKISPGELKRIHDGKVVFENSKIIDTESNDIPEFLK